MIDGFKLRWVSRSKRDASVRPQIETKWSSCASFKESSMNFRASNYGICTLSILIHNTELTSYPSFLYFLSLNWAKGQERQSHWISASLSILPDVPWIKTTRLLPNNSSSTTLKSPSGRISAATRGSGPSIHVLVVLGQSGQGFEHVSRLFVSAHAFMDSASTAVLKRDAFIVLSPNSVVRWRLIVAWLASVIMICNTIIEKVDFKTLATNGIPLNFKDHTKLVCTTLQ